MDNGGKHQACNSFAQLFRKDYKFKGAMLDQRGALSNYAGAQGTKHQIDQTDALYREEGGPNKM